jgi:anti-sigma B factor antagonist
VDVVAGAVQGTTYTRLVVTGDIDVHTGPALRDEVLSAIDSGRRRVIVDLSRVEFMDSTGLGVLVAGLNRAREAGGGLWVVCVQDRLLKLFRITGLDVVLPIYGTAEEILAADPR